MNGESRVVLEIKSFLTLQLGTFQLVSEGIHGSLS